MFEIIRQYVITGTRTYTLYLDPEDFLEWCKTFDFYPDKEAFNSYCMEQEEENDTELETDVIDDELIEISGHSEFLDRVKELLKQQ